MSWQRIDTPCRAEPAIYDTCYSLNGPDVRAHDTLNIYDANSDLWLRFSMIGGNESFLENLKKPVFRPFGPKPRTGFGIWRDDLGNGTEGQIKESSDWYEVEVDDETRETQFVSEARWLLGAGPMD